ncbi:response regulator [Pontiella agarivorans]|uniref:histidine kinase n=1 Tax=Pontiella agarivorans TaxID=3038953 RepID=A0ABU5MWM4_9BACT|nr:transporter substrate-binding domain-containing protein [Pontiella agarivorans]MDZ8118624.1 transporter substrate-binding domain-containing protein [Pontiella agarivorans]
MNNRTLGIPLIKLTLSLFLCVFSLLPANRAAASEPPQLHLSAAEQAWLQNHPEIPVIADPDGVPYSHRNDRGEFAGLLCDVLNRFTALTGSAIVYEAAIYDDIVTHIEKADRPVITGFDPPDYPAYTNAYLKSDDITFLPFALFALSHRNPDEFSPRNIAGKNVAVVEGWDPGHPALLALGKCELIYGETDLDCARMVMDGRADAVFEVAALHSFVILNHQLNDMRLIRVSPYGMPITVLTRNDYQPFHDLLNKVLRTFTPEERAGLLKKWNISPGDPHYKLLAMELTPGERSWLAEHLSLRVAVETNHKPFSWKNAEGGRSGLNIDYLRLLEKNLGMNLEFIASSGPDESLELLRKRKVDLIPGICFDPEKTTPFNLTPPYFSQDIKIYIREGDVYIRSLSDLNGKTVGLLNSPHYIEEIRREFPQLKLTEFKTPAEAVMALDAGRIDALAGDALQVGQQISELNLHSIKIGGVTPYISSLSMASREDWPVLSSIITKALGLIHPHQKEQIYARWVPRNPAPFNYSILWKVSLPGALLMLGVIAWNILLKREVKRRTFSLEAEQLLLKEAEAIALLGHWQIDLKTGITTFSDEIYRILDLDPARTTADSRLFETLAHPDDTQRVKLLFEKARDKKDLVSGDFRIVRPDESIRHVHLQCRHIHFSGKQPAHRVGILQDITQRIQLEESLHQSEKMKAIGQLAGGVAHDFNNMLGGISGATELLGMRLKDDPEALEYHAIVLKTTRRAAKLTQNLLSFSRKQQLSSQIINLHSLIRDAVILLRSSIDKRSRVELHLNAEQSNVCGDASQLQNTLLNIGINCDHAMPDGGIIDIKTELVQLEEAVFPCGTFDITPGTFLKISISDTGCGMSDDLQSRIFEPFFTTKDVGKGTGLGLASVLGTIQQHHGAIDFRSAENAGTCFHLYLPIRSDGEKEQAASSTVFRGHETILLVDDDVHVLKTTRKLLSKLGYKVLCAENGETALEQFKLRQHEISLVILDMMMPVMNGPDCFRKLRAINPQLPILMATGFSVESDLEPLLATGRCDLLHKPYFSPTLSQALRNTLQSS